MYRYALYAASRWGRTLYRKIKKQGSQMKGIRKMVDGIKPASRKMPFIWLPCLLIFIYSVFVAPKLKDMTAYAYNETLYDTKKPS